MDLQTGTEKLIARKDASLGWIIFNNPQKHNAMSQDMYRALAAVLEDYAADPAVRAIILRGEGNRAFVSGADISQFAEKRSTLEGVRASDAVSESANKALRDCPKPTIAMIRGFCMGAGLGIAVGCDVRLASDDSRFGVPAAKLGVGYGYAGITRLVDLVGPSSTAEIFYSGRQFDAHEALHMRLVNRVLPAAELEEYVLNFSNTLAANAPLTIAAVKRSLIELRNDPGNRNIALCRQMVEDCFASADYVEGRTAFMEKRKPVFKGR